MKTVVSIPDDLFKRAERFAKCMRRSRNNLFRAALEEYLERHASEDVTAAMNRVCAQVEQGHHTFVRTAGARLLSKLEW
jgi:predicted transcriptional regulator